MTRHARAALALAAVAALFGTAAAALLAMPPAQPLTATREGELPGPLADIGFDQRPGEPLPLDLVMRDADGAEVVLGDLFGERPVIVAPVYYTCPMLCGMVLNGLVTSLKTLPFEPGEDFEVVVFSFDASDGAAIEAMYRRVVDELGLADEIPVAALAS